MDKRKIIENSITSIKQKSLYGSLLWCGIFIFWAITDVILIALPDIYKSFETIFRFGTTMSLAGLYMLKAQYTSEISFVKENLISNESLSKEIKKTYLLRNFISIIIIVFAFLFRVIARIKVNIIYVIAGLLILLAAELVIYSFTKSIISKIESNL